MSPETVRAAILACPGHWTPATLARQLRVDAARLEPVLATLPGLVRDTWRGTLTLPAERRPRSRYRQSSDYAAVLRRHLGCAYPLADWAGLLEIRPRHARDVLLRHGATCDATAGSRLAVWVMPAAVIVAPTTATPIRRRHPTPTQAQRLAWLRDALAAGEELTAARASEIARCTPRRARTLLRMAGAVEAGRARGGVRWRLPTLEDASESSHDADKPRATPRNGGEG